MGWRDIYAVHPAADCWPMMPEDELAKLQEDIERNGVRMPIGLYDELDADGTVIKTWLIDGRNRLEAAEHAGLDIESIHVARVHCSNPVSWIISLNARRKHLTKQAIADGIVVSLKVAERLKRQETKPREDGEVSAKGGRGKVNKLKAEAVAAGKKLDISPRTIERSMHALVQAEGKMPKPRRRRSEVEIEHDELMKLIEHFSSDGLGSVRSMDPSNAAIDALTKEQNLC